MKKSLLVFLMSFTLLFCLVGCGNDDMNNLGGNNSMLGDMGMSDNGTTSKPDNKKEKITAERAKEIAFKHAGIKEADARDIDVELDEHGKTLHYDIDFEAHDKDYEYDINAYDGSIITSKVETDNDNTTSSNNNSNKNNDKTEQSSNKINSDAKSKAKATALKHAGLKETDIHDFEIDLDREDGKTVYEIDFKSGGYEYSYKISTETGKIIYSEKERD